MTKLSKSTKIISILLNIVCWAILIGSLYYGITYAISCFSLSSGNASGETFISGITLDNLRFYSSSGGITIRPAALRNMQLVALLVYFVEVPLICWCIQLLRKVLRPIIGSRPFSGTGILLKKLGWISLIIAAVQNLADWGMLYIMEYQYRFADFFLGSIITDVDFQFEPDATFIIVAIVVFILSGVFRYGEELQQLSDETL